MIPSIAYLGVLSVRKLCIYLRMLGLSVCGNALQLEQIQRNNFNVTSVCIWSKHAYAMKMIFLQRFAIYCYLVAFFLLATVFGFPLRVLALVRVLCPRTGRPNWCLLPR